MCLIITSSCIGRRTPKLLANHALTHCSSTTRHLAALAHERSSPLQEVGKATATKVVLEPRPRCRAQRTPTLRSIRRSCCTGRRWRLRPHEEQQKGGAAVWPRLRHRGYRFREKESPSHMHFGHCWALFGLWCSVALFGFFVPEGRRSCAVVLRWPWTGRSCPGRGTGITRACFRTIVPG